jgi:hypothetical protein
MFLTVALLAVAGACSTQQQPPASVPPSAPAQAPAVAPEVIAALEKMGGFLRTLKAFTIRADSTIDEVLDDTGQKIQFGGVIDFHVRSPDRLRVDVSSDRKQRQFFYDGTTVTLYGQRVKYYASFPAPPTIRDTLEVAAQKPTPRRSPSLSTSAQAVSAGWHATITSSGRRASTGKCGSSKAPPRYHASSSSLHGRRSRSRSSVPCWSGT